MATDRDFINALEAISTLGNSRRLIQAKRLILQEMLGQTLQPRTPRSKYKYELTPDEENWVKHYITNRQGYVWVNGVSVSPKIETIKSVRSRNTTWDLRQAKDYVEAAILERTPRKAQ